MEKDFIINVIFHDIMEKGFIINVSFHDSMENVSPYYVYVLFHDGKRFHHMYYFMILWKRVSSYVSFDDITEKVSSY